jgi:hypothetical protein
VWIGFDSIRTVLNIELLQFYYSRQFLRTISLAQRSWKLLLDS